MGLFYFIVAAILASFLDVIVICQGAQGGILSNLVNIVQMGAKNVIDQVVPSISTNGFLPRRLSNIQIPEVPMPGFAGPGRLRDFMCPRCETIDPSQLTGAWFGMYCNDNFIRNHLIRLANFRKAAEAANTTSSIFATTMKRLLTPNRTPVCLRIDMGIPVQYDFLSDIPTLISFREGFPRGELIQVLGRLRRYPDGQLIFMAGTGDNQYLLRLCIPALKLFDTESSDKETPVPKNSRQEPLILQTAIPPDVHREKLSLNSPRKFSQENSKNFNPWPGQEDILENLQTSFQQEKASSHQTFHSRNKRSLEATEKQEFLNLLTNSGKDNNLLNEQAISVSAANIITKRPGYMVIVETDGIPACQNYLILSQDRQTFFKYFDEDVLSILHEYHANRDINPLHYLGCPCSFE